MASIPRPQFPDDDGSADARVASALSGYHRGVRGERAVLAAIADTRLLVPVVAVLTEAAEVAGHTVEKESDMALPVLAGADGRRAVLGFTSTEALTRWRPDARPVAVHFRQACQAVLGERADALVVDVAGPVPFTVDGDRLRALAEGVKVPETHRDPEVLAAVHAAVTGVPGVARVKVGPGAGDTEGADDAELSVGVLLADGAAEDAVLSAVSGRLSEHLKGRVVGGVRLELIHS